MTVHHPVFARVYPLMSHAMDRGGMIEHRQALLDGLSGDVIEIGAGPGGNFPHYPPTIRRVNAVEPEAHLRRQAQEEAEHAPVDVAVVDGLADHLPADDGSMDAAVVSLVLCSVPDQQVALREIRRVLKPGGQLRFLEHVKADSRGLARAQRVLDATIWPHLAGGCHSGRDTAAAIEQAGLTIGRLDRFLFPQARTPLSFYIRGSAVTRS
ncbi:MAG: class I SAM-dependent methyltransferase [Thermocrispum sp.]